MSDSPIGIADFDVTADYRFCMARQCSRQGCVHPATATLSFQYSRSLAWLEELTAQREPHSYDLCDQHADRTKPPSGWHMEDRRPRVHVYDAGRLAG